MPRGMPYKSTGMRRLPPQANDGNGGNHDDSELGLSAQDDYKLPVESYPERTDDSAYDVIAAADEVTLKLRELLVAQASPRSPPTRSPVRPLGPALARPPPTPSLRGEPRRTKQSEKVPKSFNACAVAVFLMGLNLGLTVLLTVLVASHGPNPSLDMPRFLTDHHPLGTSSFSTTAEQAAPGYDSNLSPGTPGVTARSSAAPELAALAPPPPVALSHGLASLFTDELPALPAIPGDSADHAEAPRILQGASPLAPPPAPCNSTRIASWVSSQLVLTPQVLAQRRRDAEAACRARQCKVSCGMG